ncbi:glycine betaine/L-proline ABC transporter ATP-binding protein [Cereibacter changlensis]|uniref:Quaternary amine transport ATP-binding protein n=1 Tax=Cereibacter changlensis TaxID=402884 RepID=A0A4U0Z1M4_9RHOB|nr:glycine betaine/L-proline ABC transporter ATP-binding protein [Cereibacter changlensis]TKA96251.1 glycine betaine/L-proline ABC transporter ATP-binding protein [Cereibacter changlensis]
MQAKLSVRNVFKIFGDTPAAALERLRQGESKATILEATGATVGVQDASFEVGEGEIFVVMGLSGSGKSTLVRMLNGLIPPSSGEILIDGEDIASCSPQALRRIRREKVAMIFQHFALFPHWTVVGNVAYGLKVKGMGAAERRARAMETLEQVGLAPWADSLPSDLSGGMQQRVGLARGLATGPQILLMDEPFGALDPLIRRQMQEELLILQKTLKKTIVFITHDLNEALLLGDRIAIMKDGQLVQTGTAQEIVTAPADDYVAAFVADIDRGRVFTAEDISGPPTAVQLHSDTPDQARRLMEDADSHALHVVDGERLVGLVTYKDLTAQSPDAMGRPGTLRQALITDFATTDGNAPLHTLYTDAGSGLPIAVTDGRKRLVGVVQPRDVLAQLSTETQTPTTEAADAQPR